MAAERLTHHRGTALEPMSGPGARGVQRHGASPASRCVCDEYFEVAIAVEISDAEDVNHVRACRQAVPGEARCRAPRRGRSAFDGVVAAEPFQRVRFEGAIAVEIGDQAAGFGAHDLRGDRRTRERILRCAAGRDRNTTATCGTTVNADDRRATRLAIGARTDAPHTLVFSQEATWIGRRLVMRCDEMTMHLAVEPQHHEAVRRCGHGRARDRLIRRPGDIAAREQGEQMRSAQRGVEARLSYQDARQSGGGRFGRRGIDPGGQGRWRGAMSSRGRFRRMSAARGDGEYLYEARLHRAQASTTRRMTA